MDQLTRMLAGLLRGLAGLLGEQRRDWVHALLAETDDLPAPSARLAWLGGGLWLVAREVLMNRIIQALTFVAGAVGLVWIAWPGAVVVADYLVLACFVLAALAVPVAVHAVAARLADRDTRPGILSPARQAMLATTGAIATAAILVALFTTLTIALLPHHFTGPQQPAGDGICPTCEPSTTIIPTNLRHEYYFEGRVNGAGDGAIALLIVPLIGAALGALRGHLRYPPAATRPEGLPEGA